jgi:hypothetical protein
VARPLGNGEFTVTVVHTSPRGRKLLKRFLCAVVVARVDIISVEIIPVITSATINLETESACGAIDESSTWTVWSQEAEGRYRL